MFGELCWGARAGRSTALLLPAIHLSYLKARVAPLGSAVRAHGPTAFRRAIPSAAQTEIHTDSANSLPYVVQRTTEMRAYACD